MYLSRLARLKHLEETDVEEEGQRLILRIEYAQGPDGEPAYEGPQYAYVMRADGVWRRAEEAEEAR
jgi:hypothetical protein